MARPSVPTRKTPTKAPADVRTAAKKGSVSSAAARNAAKTRAKSSSASSYEFSGLPTLDLSGILLELGSVVLDSYSSGQNASSPDVPPSPTSKFYIRSYSTETATSNQRITYVFPVSPNEVSVNRIPIAYTEIPRPGRKPILKSAGRQLKQVTATLMVVAPGKAYLDSAQPQIDALEALSQIDSDMNIFYPGIDPAARWRITDLSFRTVRRNTDNVVTLAEANITFSEVIALPSPVAGMPKIKDVPGSRRSSTNPGATTDTQRGGDQGAIDIVLAAGPKPNNPGGTGFVVTP